MNTLWPEAATRAMSQPFQLFLRERVGSQHEGEIRLSLAIDEMWEYVTLHTGLDRIAQRHKDGPRGEVTAREEQGAGMRR